MASVPQSLPWSHAGVPDLLGRAASVLAREVSRLPGGLDTASLQSAGLQTPDPSADTSDLAGRVCPVVGAQVPLAGAEKPDLRQQAHELLAGLFAVLGQSGGVPEAAHSAPSGAMKYPGQALEPAGRACPVTLATLPPGGFDKDQLRRHAHEFIDTLLVTFRQVTSEDGVVADTKVPLLQCAAPVQAGGIARWTLTIANDEATPSEVSLYCTNLVTDSGYEIPSMRVSSSPRVASIPPHGQLAFEIRVAVPPQTPSGAYSGLIQAMGSKYIKAVLSLQVI